MSSTIPKIYVPKEGMTLDDIPITENEEVQGNVRASLLLVEGDSSNRKVSLKADYRDYAPDMNYIDVTAEDIIWKWQDMQAKGSGYDGVFKSVVGNHTVYHFWDNSANNPCDETHNVQVDFPLSLGEDEAVWLGEKTGLMLKNEVCRAGAEGEGRDYYRFNWNPAEMKTYHGRIEEAEAPEGVRADEIRESMEESVNSGFFEQAWYEKLWDGLWVGAGFTGAAGAGAALWKGIQFIGSRAAMPMFFIILSPCVIDPNDPTCGNVPTA